MSLADYLAKNYLSEDKKSKKKTKSKKEKHASVAIVKEDITGWDSLTDDATVESTTPAGKADEAEEDSRKKSAGWKKVGGSTVRKRNEEESGIKPERDEEARMESGARAGLQTAAQVQRDIERKQCREQKEMELLGAVQTQTVYRDASGRIIDLKAKINEQKKAEQERIERKRRLREINQGLVQRAQAKESREQLERIKDVSLYITEDDRLRNEDMRSRDRFNDPAAKFLKKSSPSKSVSYSSRSSRKIYKGAYGPNRFNIPPGPLWDGVDRSNGFENRWLQKQNERKERAALSYQMAIDD